MISLIWIYIKDLFHYITALRNIASITFTENGFIPIFFQLYSLPKDYAGIRPHPKRDKIEARSK